MHYRLPKRADRLEAKLNLCRALLVLTSAPICVGVLGCTGYYAWDLGVERYQVENDSEDTGIELFAEYWSTSGSPRDPTKSYSSSQYVRIHRPDGTKWDIDLSGDHPMYWEVYVTTPAGRVKKLDIEYVGYQETLPLPAFTPHSDTE